MQTICGICGAAHVRLFMARTKWRFLSDISLKIKSFTRKIIKNGESPVKADGRLFVIDGGISKAYQKATGIAGYTLIYDSHSLNLAEHKPFIAGESEHTPEIHMVERLDRRANISDTDKGRELLLQINDLRDLLDAYRSGDIKEGYKVF